MAQPPEITAGGAQPHVGPDSPPLNLQETSRDLEKGAQPSAGLFLEQNNTEDTDDIQEGSNSPIMTTAASATQAPQVNLTAQDRNNYQPLYLAAQRGDWKRAKSFIDRDPNALTARISDELDTVLLVAAQCCRWEFILNLLGLLSPESIAASDIYGLTVLHYVAEAGTLRTAKALVEKNADLLHMVDDLGRSPLLFAILHENKELVWYFSSITRAEYPSLPTILCNLNQTGFLDVSLYFFQKYPELALDRNIALLFCLASKPSYFFSGSSTLGFFERWIYKLVPVNIEEIPGNIEGSPALQPRSFVAQVFQLFKRLLWKAMAQLAPIIKVVRDMKLKHKCAVELVNLVCKQLSSMRLQEIVHFLENPSPILSTAITNGIEEIVSTLLQYFPELILKLVVRQPRRNILQVAIENRQEKIVNVVKEVSPLYIKNMCADILESKNTTLHLVGKLAPAFKLRSISGAALQMQRELQWFKEVEKITYPSEREKENLKKKTAKEVFWEAHKGLAVQGEKWMKDTANYCMLVSTLIATVLFAAAFTVPGGDINDKGTPVFLWANAFVLFTISDAIGLFSSLTSLLMFLAILTARYAVDDFLKSLPKKLIIGLGSLFLAIAAMIIAFGATLTIILSERWHWVSMPITLLACFPVAIFVMLQLPLFIQMVQSTYGQSISSSFWI